MKEETIKRLDKSLKAFTGTIPNINAGGCGFFALALADVLAARGEKPTIVEFGDKIHLVVRVGRHYFDACGLFAEGASAALRRCCEAFQLPAYCCKPRKVPLDVLREQAENDSLWNWCFKRSYKAELPRRAEWAVEYATGNGKMRKPPET